MTVSPDVRAILAITLINEIVVTGAEENQCDLTLFFLGFPQPTLATLQRLIPTLVDVTASLSTAQVFLGVASVTERTRSEANKARVVAKIDAKGDDFLRGLERYRLGADPITEDDQKLTALQKFFALGHQIFQFSLLQIAALNSMINKYFKIIPTTQIHLF